MNELPFTIIFELVMLTVFLTFITGLKYVLPDNFTRTRVIMTAFFVFIVCALTVSFWRLTLVTLPFTVPTFILGVVVGYAFGVRTAERKLAKQGVTHYKESFAHIKWRDVASLHWWSLINYYSIVGGLLLINLVGLSTVIFEGERWAIFTSSAGAFLLGSIVPYLFHLWGLMHKESSR